VNLAPTTSEIIPALQTVSDRSLLIVEDDKAFLERLARAMEARGFIVTTS
jgi:two-component system response regulator RegA